MNEIQILPIFNQSTPGVWDDFFRIRAASMLYMYNYHSTCDDLAASNQFFIQDWQNCPYNFAFGAYLDKKMIGFIQGNCDNGTATISNLYVHPNFMSKVIDGRRESNHVGARLIRSAECASSITSTYVVLTALAEACGFYEHSGYTAADPSLSLYFKQNNKLPSCSVIPIFAPVRPFVRACKKISDANRQCLDLPKFKTNERAPMFAYTDVNSKICGYAIGEINTTRISQIGIAPHKPTDLITNIFRRNFNMLDNQKSR